MTLSIIIPCNQNTLKNHDLTRLFNSLNNQVHTDWDEVEVILVHPYAKYKFDMSQFLELKPYFKAYYCKQNTYSAIKQFGLEIAQGDYVLFLMPDSIIYGMTGLIDVLQAIVDNSVQDYLLFNVGDCINVNPDTGDIGQLNSLYTLDGKVFKRDFLINNDINFLNGITSGEDLYFTQKILNLNPQYAINNTVLILKTYQDDLAISYEEQYLNQIQVLSTVNTENVITTTNMALDKIVQMLLQVYETLYSYANEDYRRLVKVSLKNFILGMQNLVNINAIFAKCMEVSNNYINNDIIALNNDKTFYEFIISIFVDEQENENTAADEEIEIKEVVEE